MHLLQASLLPAILTMMLTAAQHLSCGRYQGHVSAALVLGGVDFRGPHLFTVSAPESACQVKLVIAVMYKYPVPKVDQRKDSFNFRQRCMKNPKNKECSHRHRLNVFSSSFLHGNGACKL